MATAAQKMKTSIQVRGYAVIGCLVPRHKDEVIPSVNQGDEENEFLHPFVVIEETDKADYEEQCRLSGDSTYLNPAYKFFYRVRTD